MSLIDIAENKIRKYEICMESFATPEYGYVQIILEGLKPVRVCRTPGFIGRNVAITRVKLDQFYTSGRRNGRNTGGYILLRRDDTSLDLAESATVRAYLKCVEWRARLYSRHLVLNANGAVSEDEYNRFLRAWHANNKGAVWHV